MRQDTASIGKGSQSASNNSCASSAIVNDLQIAGLFDAGFANIREKPFKTLAEGHQFAFLIVENVAEFPGANCDQFVDDAAHGEQLHANGILHDIAGELGSLI